MLYFTYLPLLHTIPIESSMKMKTPRVQKEKLGNTPVHWMRSSASSFLINMAFTVARPTKELGAGMHLFPLPQTAK
jgi:hypothetical protein